MPDTRALNGVERKYGMERTAKTKPYPRFKPPYIRQWRQDKGLSLEALASNVPMDKGNLSKVERGHLPYNQEMIERIADIIGVEPASIIGRDPTKDGKVVDMLQHLNPSQLQQAEAILMAAFPRASNAA